VIIHMQAQLGLTWCYMLRNTFPGICCQTKQCQTLWGTLCIIDRLGQQPMITLYADFCLHSHDSLLNDEQNRALTVCGRLQSLPVVFCFCRPAPAENWLSFCAAAWDTNTWQNVGMHPSLLAIIFTATIGD